MAEPEITHLFGDGSTQTATQLTISKPGLAAILTAAGYTFNPTANNTLDELVAAIICAGLVRLTPENRAIDPQTRNIEFNYDPSLNFDSPTLEGQTYNRHTIDVNFYKPIATPKLNPADF